VAAFYLRKCFAFSHLFYSPAEEKDFTSLQSKRIEEKSYALFGFINHLRVRAPLSAGDSCAEVRTERAKLVPGPFGAMPLE
jgi:hypothetical protein